MIRKINIAQFTDDVGYYGEWGAVIGDYQEILIEGNAGTFLVSIDNFEQETIDGLPCVKPKAKLLLAIGGLPKSEADILAEEKGVSVACAHDILYLRTRSRWTEELEQRLIRIHNEGKEVSMSSFGVSAQTQASLYWKSAKSASE